METERSVGRKSQPFAVEPIAIMSSLPSSGNDEEEAESPELKRANTILDSLDELDHFTKATPFSKSRTAVKQSER